MNLNEKYTNNLIIPDRLSMKGGVCRINEDTKGILIEEVTKVEFNSLYPNLLVRLHEEGVLKRLGISIDPHVVHTVGFFLKNRYAIKSNIEEYNKYRTWVNSIYIKDVKDQAYQLFDVYYQYTNQYYNDIQDLNKYTWLYTDTDVMYFAGRDVVIPDIELPRTEDIVELLYIEGKKKYIEYTNGFKVKGYPSRHQPNDIISMMRQKIRERKLDSIGI